MSCCNCHFQRDSGDTVCVVLSRDSKYSDYYSSLEDHLTITKTSLVKILDFYLLTQFI